MQLSSSQTDETASSADLGNQYGDYNGLTGHSGKFFPSWTDRRGGGNEQIWTAPITTTDCQFVIDQSTYGQNDVEIQLPGTATSAVGWVQVDGFLPSEILSGGNLNNPLQVPTVTETLDSALPSAVATAIQGMLLAPSIISPIVPLLAAVPDEPQGWLFPFNISFKDDSGFLAMRAATPPIVSTFITLAASITIGQTTVATTARIELTTGEDPRFVDVNPKNPGEFPSWLSFDLRFFKMAIPPNGSEQRFGATVTDKTDDAPTFIAQVIANLTGNTAGETFDPGPNGPGLTQDEDATKLEWLPHDNSGNVVFNYAVARVRLIGKVAGTAKNVRVFFRLFQAQNTASNFDPSANTGTYRFASDNTNYGHKIPRLGVQNDQNGTPEYVTIPCFATKRIVLNDPTQSMDAQQDAPNAYDLTTVPGAETDYYFGCWIDNNQTQPVMPATPPANSSLWDGPWPAASLTPVSAAMTAFPHQCLIAEIRFDDTPIPPGATSGSSDKLAQRNIAWIDGPNPGAVASRRMSHPVQLRATPISSSNPDELMILWGNTPQTSTANLYLPAINASDILRIADRRYPEHGLRLIDPHTIGCDTGGATLIPLPGGTALTAGLLAARNP